ncbi:FliM/FliN family flagellar motor switch protein [Pseudomonas sp. A-RE-23]|uniref:FliM/FliN family flagellar motor switch protein n=1 Tax=Pseudomonas sp. A-RE-23 TaxID=2832376 RepID=UPI001CBD37AD|nr:FliM/FliN family flagellar motor C-terminal domain-containing protein [Pseudomonas sp. A-RE-23]
MPDARHTCEVNCTALDDSREWPSTTLAWQRAKSAHGSISLAGDAASMIFGPFMHDAPEDETARHLVREAQLALINDVLEVLGQSGVSHLTVESSQPSSGLLSAQVLLQLRVGQLTLHLSLDAALFNAALEKPVAPTPLIERKHALGNARVKLSVRLPLASLSIGEMRDLRPGDTLRASALLADPVSVQLAEGPVIAGGYLAKQHGQVAVQLISHE